jgi:hypothetical protein
VVAKNKTFAEMFIMDSGKQKMWLQIIVEMAIFTSIQSGSGE